HLLSQPEEFLSQPQIETEPQPQRQPETEPQPEPSTSYGEADQPESDQAEPEPGHSEPTVEADLVDITQTPAVYTRRGVRVKTVCNKRPIVPAEVYRSPYLQRNTNILKDFTQAEKNVLDFILVESLDEREFLFKSETQTLTRRQLKSLVEGDQVSPDVINVWCEILNSGESLRSRDSACRLFVPHSTDSCLDNFDVAAAQLVSLLFGFIICSYVYF
ncbi:hypothetical protein KSS87_000494, partial [Heliosperma pusillum]